MNRKYWTMTHMTTTGMQTANHPQRNNPTRPRKKGTPEAKKQGGCVTVRSQKGQCHNVAAPHRANQVHMMAIHRRLFEDMALPPKSRCKKTRRITATRRDLTNSSSATEAGESKLGIQRKPHRRLCSMERVVRRCGVKGWYRAPSRSPRRDAEARQAWRRWHSDAPRVGPTRAA